MMREQLFAAVEFLPTPLLQVRSLISVGDVMSVSLRNHRERVCWRRRCHRIRRLNDSHKIFAQDRQPRALVYGSLMAGFILSGLASAVRVPLDGVTVSWGHFPESMHRPVRFLESLLIA